MLINSPLKMERIQSSETLANNLHTPENNPKVDSQHKFKMFIQGLSKRFQRFKFGIFYILIVKIRYNFTHKSPSLFTSRNQLTNAQCKRHLLLCKCQYENLT